MQTSSSTCGLEKTSRILAEVSARLVEDPSFYFFKSSPRIAHWGDLPVRHKNVLDHPGAGLSQVKQFQLEERVEGVSAKAGTRLIGIFKELTEASIWMRRL
jgi:hypothetical protein